ncbi:MAG: hypothetical protein RM368_35720 [Nostoc sp. DedSLP03]|nr:hypothetical protein [Nostoc sp. DedSLP03]
MSISDLPAARLCFNDRQRYRFLATFGDLGWGKAEGRRKRKEKFPQLKHSKDYRTSASLESRKRSPLEVTNPTPG